MFIDSLENKDSLVLLEYKNEKKIPTLYYIIVKSFSLHFLDSLIEYLYLDFQSLLFS